MGVQLSEPVDINDIQAITVYNAVRTGIRDRIHGCTINLALDYTYDSSQSRSGFVWYKTIYTKRSYYLIKGPAFYTLPDTKKTSSQNILDDFSGVPLGVAKVRVEDFNDFNKDKPCRALGLIASLFPHFFCNFA